jgi:hypothetical protein
LGIVVLVGPAVVVVVGVVVVVVVVVGVVVVVVDVVVVVVDVVVVVVGVVVVVVVVGVVVVVVVVGVVVVVVGVVVVVDVVVVVGAVVVVVDVVVAFGSQGTGAVVVVPAPGQAGRVSVPYRAMPTERSPRMSPMAITHRSPMASWAGVGGHGKAAAAVWGLPPKLLQPAMTVPSSMVHWGPPAGGGPVGLSVGGPRVPIFIVMLTGPNVPVLDVGWVTMAEQLTGTSLPEKIIWGCDASVLHSSCDAVVPWAKPEPDTETTEFGVVRERPLHTGP